MAPTPEESVAVDTAANAAFWDELCGTQLAKSLGISGDTPDDLRRYDEFYLDFYPYLWPFIQQAPLEGKRVLEIGLGYGTVGQRLVEAGARYVGMDIARGPTQMMANRHGNLGAPRRAVRGNGRRMPFPDGTFDVVVAIGCLHHSGDFPGAIGEVARVLRPGGTALVMVYNRFSYDQWLNWPVQTLRAWLADRGFKAGADDSSTSQRGRYDLNDAGQAAPITDFFSGTQTREIFRDFSAVSWQRMNCHEHRILNLFGLTRKRLLPFMGWLGLDLYITARR